MNAKELELTHLEHARDVRTTLLKDSNDVVAACLGLLGDATLDQVTLSVGRDLARHEDVLADLNSLGLEDGCVSDVADT